MHAYLSSLALASLIAPTTATNIVSSGVKTTVDKPRGKYEVWHDADVPACCSVVLLLTVGTAMSVQDYSMLSTKMIDASGGATGVIFIDNNPRSIVKTSGTKLASIANAIVKDIASHLPAENPRYFVGGHSAGGQAAVEALAAKAFSFPVHGFIGMAPYEVDPTKMSLAGVPSMNWGFQHMTCGVTPAKAGRAAYTISEEGHRVFYDVDDKTWNHLTGGPHCIFTNSSCLGLCHPKKDLWMQEGVAQAVHNFTTVVATGAPFTGQMFAAPKSSVDVIMDSTADE